MLAGRRERALRIKMLKPKPELGIQFGAGGATNPDVLQQEGVRSAD